MIENLDSFPPLVYNNKTNKIPNNPSNTTGLPKLPKATNVAGSETTNPAFFKPMKAIKNPIPAPMANFKSLGIAFIISFLRPVKLTIKNKTPDTKTAASASCHEKLRPKTMV